jgi:AcrR family transcriptional regulator
MEISLPESPPARRLTRRGRDMRERILGATIHCIVRSGFAAMTVETVMAEAGISRGSVLHQFPTRLALAAATAERAMEVVMDAAEARARAIADPFERLAGYADIVWQIHSGPEGLALTEVLQGAGWDRDLADVIRPIARIVEARVRDASIVLARGAGIADVEAVVVRGWLLLSTVRGLIIEYRLYEGRPMIEAAIAEMKAGHRRFCLALLKSSQV